MELVVKVAIASWDIMEDSAIFILGGFLLAGVIKAAMPMKIVGNFLGGTGSAPVVRAAIIGIPLPLCSCSVLPSAITLKEKGASRGAVSSFLIATPESGVDSISISYALLDPLMTISRPIAAFVTAITAGLLETVFNSEDGNEKVLHSAGSSDLYSSSCKGGDCSGENENGGFISGVKFAFIDLMDDIALWMTVGIVLAGCVMALFPDDVFTGFIGSSYVAMPIMLIAGVPMYICATSSTPLAAAMILKGLSPGAALVFLLAGPATNIGSVMIIKKFMGTRSLVIYLTAIAVCSIALGSLLNVLYMALDINPSATMGSAADIFPDNLETVCAILLSGIMARSLVSIGKKKLLSL